LSKTVHDITSTVKLLNPHIDISGYDNYIATYLILGEKKVLIDIGPRAGVNGRLQSLAEVGVSPEDIDYLVLTHVHIDHAGGTGTALKDLKNARVFVHPRGRQHLVDPTALWQSSLETSPELALKYGRFEPVTEGRITIISDEEKLELGGELDLEFILTPGHASHHMSIFESQNRIIFSGDSAGLYTSGVLRLTAPPPFRVDSYLSSIDRMIKLQPELIAYGHFGCYPDAVKRLKKTKEKVQTWFEIAQAGVNAGKIPEQVVGDIKEQDKELDYFKKLDKATFERDNYQFMLTVRGLMTAK
jgi:glyoxylase-like metal-dependent hydrolase (beta-lactamase superfamily II)